MMKEIKASKTHSSGFYFMITAICSLAVLLFSLFSENSDILNGVGSDGIYYARFTPDFIDQLKAKAIMPQIVERMLPITIAHFIYDIFFREGDTLMVFTQGGESLYLSKNIVQTYKYLNAIYLILAIIIWSIICFRFAVTKQLFFLSLSLLTLNFMFLKQFFFEPVFLDQFVFFYAMVVLYAVVFEKKWAFPLLLISSFFVNKLVTVVIILIILFNDKPENSFTLKWNRNYLLILWIAAFLAVSVYLIYNPLCTEDTEVKTMYFLLALSIPASILYTIFFWLSAVPRMIHLNISKNRSYYLAIIAGGGLYFVIVQMFAGEPVPLCEGLDQNFMTQVFNFVRTANSRPFGFLSSHFNYFGVFVLLTFFFVSRIRQFLEMNQGWILLFLCFLGMSYNVETRQLTFLFPFIVWMLITAPGGNNYRIFHSKLFLGVVGVVNIIWSGFYIKINPLGTWLYYTSEDVIFSNVFIYPLQKYFKHVGITTNTESYYLQLTIFIASLAMGYLFIIFLKKKFTGQSKYDWSIHNWNDNSNA